MRVCDKNGMWWTVKDGGIKSTPIVSGPYVGENIVPQFYTLQFCSDNGDIIYETSPFPLEYYSQGHEDKLVELLEKALLEESRKRSPDFE